MIPFGLQRGIVFTAFPSSGRNNQIDELRETRPCLLGDSGDHHAAVTVGPTNTTSCRSSYSRTAVMSLM